jgi:hypothetical protein
MQEKVAAYGSIVQTDIGKNLAREKKMKFLP